MPRGRRESALARGVHKSVRRESELVESELVWNALARIESWIERSRAASDVLEHAELQRELAAAALECRDLDRQLKKEKEALRSQLRLAPDQNARTQIGSGLDAIELRLDGNRRRMVALRSVQDGIIWRLLGFDRAVLATLGLGPQVGYPSASFESELAAAEEHWERRELAVLTDLSTCVRTGDLLVVDVEARRFHLAEVKASARAGRRGERQRKRLEAQRRFLIDGQSDALSGDRTLHLSTEHPRLRNHLPTLGEVFRKARRTVVAGAQVAPHLYVNVLDARAALEEAERFGAVIATQRVQLRHERYRPPPAWERQETIGFASHERLQRDEHAATATTAPISIYPFKPGTCAALALGLVTYQVTLNLDVVYQYLLQRGWRIGPPLDETPDIWMTVASVTQTGATMHGVNVRMREQLQIELLSLGALGDAIEAGFKDSRRLGGAHVAYAWRWDEAHAWK